MKGLRAISRAVVSVLELAVRETNDGAKAAEEETKAVRRRAENFMISRGLMVTR
jgi:hypothetical protein